MSTFIIVPGAWDTPATMEPMLEHVAGMDPAVQHGAREYLERTQRPQGIAALRERWRGELRTPANSR